MYAAATAAAEQASLDQQPRIAIPVFLNTNPSGRVFNTCLLPLPIKCALIRLYALVGLQHPEHSQELSIDYAQI